MMSERLRHLRHPADEVDPDLQVEVVVRMAGFTYRAFVVLPSGDGTDP